jgi:hypothetical protein
MANLCLQVPMNRFPAKERAHLARLVVTGWQDDGAELAIDTMSSFIAPSSLSDQQGGSGFALLAAQEPQHYTFRGQLPVSCVLSELLGPVESIYQSYISQTAAHRLRLERSRHPVLEGLPRRE